MVVVFIGISVLVLMLWEPHIEGRNAYATLYQIYFNDPFLAYAYTASIAFFVAVYKVFKLLGYIRQNKTTYDWIIKDQQQILKFVELIYPLLIVKKKQAILAKKILEKKVKSFSDLKNVAKLADKLASLNVRSKNRRKNFSSIVVKKVISPND